MAYLTYMGDEKAQDIEYAIDIKNEEQMLQFVASLHYLVIFPDGSKHFFTSLRAIGKAIAIDYTTISKKLGRSESCICIAKDSDYPFWVRRL